MDDIKSQLRLLHYNRDYVSLAMGDYMVSNTVEAYEYFFDIVSKLMSEADASIGEHFNQSDFVYSRAQVNQLIDTTKLADEDFIYNPRPLNDLDWDALNQKLVDSADVHYLLKRGVTMETIVTFKMCRICDIPEEYKIMAGAKVHPAINVHAETEPEGYCFPVFNHNKEIIGSICRFQNLMPEIKWCASIPCYYLYSNLHLSHDPSKIEEIYICEGLFDGFGFQDRAHVNWISLSSGYFSEFQFINLLLLLMNYPNVKKLHLVLDSDAIGILSMYIAKSVLSGLLKHTNISIDCYLLPTGKDPGEHFCRDKKSIEDLELADNKTLIDVYNKVKRYTEPRRFEEYLEARKKQQDTEVYNYK